eukprot:SAG31_NODE_1508_length_8063_cov_3.156956_7_plen_233_part_00
MRQKPPLHHASWSYNPGQNGDPRNISKVMPGATFWWCYARNAEPKSQDGSAISVATTTMAPNLTKLCTCSSPSRAANGAIKALSLTQAFPGAPCPGLTKQLGIRATCVSADPPTAPFMTTTPSAVPTALRLEFLESPVLGLDRLQPHFGWMMPVAEQRQWPDEMQSAAQVSLHDSYGQEIWNSGRVNSSVPLLVPSSPLPLASDQAYSWGEQNIFRKCKRIIWRHYLKSGPF